MKRKIRLSRILYTFIALIAIMGFVIPGVVHGEENSRKGKYALSEKQKSVAEKLTSVFENGTTTLDYGYAEDLGDGRGITCGRAGYCTGTGDALEVVRKYTEKKPENILAKYLDSLIKIENQRLETNENQSDTSLLTNIGNFSSDWALAAQDKAFIKVQDIVADELYFAPSQKMADSLGLKLPLSRAVLYDTIIQHGNGDDPDSLLAIVKLTNKKAGGTPLAKVNEKKWLKHFLNIRRACLLNPQNEETRQEWAASVGRVDVFLNIYKDNNFSLNKSITIKVKDWKGIKIQ